MKERKYEESWPFLLRNRWKGCEMRRWLEIIWKVKREKVKCIDILAGNGPPRAWWRGLVKEHRHHAKPALTLGGESDSRTTDDGSGLVPVAGYTNSVALYFKDLFYIGGSEMHKDFWCSSILYFVICNLRELKFQLCAGYPCDVDPLECNVCVYIAFLKANNMYFLSF